MRLKKGNRDWNSHVTVAFQGIANALIIASVNGLYLVMSPTQTAFYQSIAEMKQSYLADLQMVGNYQKVVEAEAGKAVSEHMVLLQNQLSLLIETIDQLLTFR